MANRPSMIEIAIQTASYDGRFYGRYPTGNKPNDAIAGTPSSISSAVAALTTGGGSGGGLSSLATLANATTPGTWATTWADGFLAGSIDNPAGDDPSVSNGTKASWDPIGKVHSYCGRGHGFTYQSVMLDMPDATHTWSNAGNTPFPSGTQYGQGHQFVGQVGDPNTGDLYFGWVTGDIYVRKQGTNTWTNIGNRYTAAHGFAGLAFNPHMGSKGTLLVGSWYGIDAYDVNSGTWSSIYAGFGAGGFVIGSGSDGGETPGYYDETAQAVHFCGGTDNRLANLRVDKTGTLIQMGNLPTPTGIPQSTNTVAVVIDGYISTSTLSSHPTSGTVRKPMIVQPGGPLWEYDSTNDLWDLISGITCPNSTDPNNAIFIEYVQDVDSIILWCQTDSIGGMTAHVFRRN